MTNSNIIELPVNKELLEVARYLHLMLPLNKRLTKLLVETCAVGYIEAQRAVEAAKRMTPKRFVRRTNRFAEAAQQAFAKVVRKQFNLTVDIKKKQNQ